MFFKRLILGFLMCVIKRKCFEIVYNIWVKFSFFLDWHSYILQKLFNLDDITNENNRYHNLKWPYIPNHPTRILIIGGSGSGEINALLH